MVATPHHLASMAAARILIEGGNAVDAAIAANAVLTVVYPHNCSLGGDAFWLIYHSSTGKLRGLNGSGRSPYSATREFFKDQGMSQIPLRGILPVTVPGVVDSWCTMLEEYGSRELREVLRPAIHYAREGFPVGEKLSRWIKYAAPVLSACPTSKKIFLRGGRASELGEILVQRDLARTLDKLAKGGREVFYEGDISESIVKFCRQNGGLLSEQDFTDHKSDWIEPIGASYRGYGVYEFPPNSQGVAALLGLNIVEGFDLAPLGHLSAQSIHLMVEAKKLAFADRDRYVSDPERSDIPVEELISKSYGRKRRRKIDLCKAMGRPSPGNPFGGDTVYLATLDKDGNAVSLIQSIYFDFGCGMVAGDTGILLQNRGAYFSLSDDHVNRLEPHKRTLHTLAPAMMFENDELRMVFGTMGGDGQPQTHLQLVTNIVDFGMNIQEAIEAPRWLHGRVEIGELEQVLNLEEGIRPAVVRELRRKGHRVRVLERWNEKFGHAQAIFIHPSSKVLMGGADPRGDGVAVGW